MTIHQIISLLDTKGKRDTSSEWTYGEVIGKVIWSYLFPALFFIDRICW